jgi:hypothetical protein
MVDVHKLHDDEYSDGLPDFVASHRLTPERLAERAKTIRGSCINILASGDYKRINRLFKEKTGELQPEDLSSKWPIQFGQCTEILNLHTFEQKNGVKIDSYQRVVRSASEPWMAATLDGATYLGGRVVIDAKWTAGRPFEGEEWSDVLPRIVRYNTPQLHWGACILGEIEGRRIERGVLSIIRGANPPTTHFVELKQSYTDHLIELGRAFMQGVKKGEMPFIDFSEEPPVPVEERQPYDMEKDVAPLKQRAWKRNADVWLQTKGAADSFKQADKNLKLLIPRDASTASGAGISVRVSSNGAKRIMAEEADKNE